MLRFRIAASRKSLNTSIRLGWFLAVRQIMRASKATTLLIIFVMALTFVNLVFIGGILIGLMESASIGNRQLYTGDVFISALDDKQHIEDSRSVLRAAEVLPWARIVSPRLVAPATIEGNYRTRTDFANLPDTMRAELVGIDPDTEHSATGLDTRLVAGSYLAEDDTEGILLGASLLYQYTPVEIPGYSPLKDVYVGDKVRVTVNGVDREFTVRGILKSKVDAVDSRAFIIAPALRDIAGSQGTEYNEILIRLENPDTAILARDALISIGVGEHARVQTWLDAQPKFLKDISDTFSLLGNIVGTIGLLVASITVFIVIFINAITRRKFIGILRGVGINSLAIEISYVLQALFYAIVGSVIGVLVILLFLKPWFIAHPIDFPFSDGILSTTPEGIAIRVVLLILASLIAGYIPARIVIKQSPLDAILGR